MPKTFSTVLILLTFWSCSSDTITDSEIHDESVNNETDLIEEFSDQEPSIKTIEELIPEDMQILGEASGFLNDDELLDKVLVLKMNTEVPGEFSETPRNVMILEGNQDEGWEIRGNNPNIVYCQGCGGVFGDPFDSVSIHDKIFSISHYGGSADRWARTISFEYNNKIDTWVLREDLEISFSAIEPDSDTTYTFYNKDQYGETLFDDYTTD